MVDRLSGALLKLGQNAPVAVTGVVSNDGSNMPHQLLVLFAGAVRAALPVIVGALRKFNRSKAPVQPALLSVLIHQADFLVGGQLSPKKLVPAKAGISRGQSRLPSGPPCAPV